eukprot:g13545.t1
MPRAAITDDEGAKALEAAGTDIKYLLSRHEVSLDNQKLFFHHGVTTLEKLSNFAKDRDDLALVLKDHWELDASRSLEERVQVAAITCAFINAKTRSQRAAEVDAEYDTLQWSRPVVAGEWAAMRSALEKRYGHLEDKIYPSKEYIEKKLAEVEHGEYRAEELTEVVSKEEIEPDSVVPIWDSKGRLAMRRGSTKVEEPTNAEELRRRLSIWKNAMVMISLKHSNRHELQGAWEDTVEQYKDYLLGDYVFGLSAKDAEGQTFASPPWKLVIAYERAIRKQAVKITNTEGKPLTVALKMAWKDATIKERNFTTPLALYAKRPTPPWREQPQAKWPTVEKGGKGREKGKSKKGRGKGSNPHCATHTPDGEMICFRYNTPGEKCKSSKCKYKHVCGICYSDRHPLYECNPKNRKEAVEKEAFKMAKGGNAFSLVRNEEFLARIRCTLAENLGIAMQHCPEEGQPFFLDLMRGVLEKAGDPDWAFLEQAKVGLPLGILNQRPRTPEIFEEQLRWNLESEDWSSAVWQKESYVSAAEHEKYLTEHLEQEVAEGLMTKMSEEAFVATYGEDRAVAALAVLVEDEVTGKKRVIHDGTHGVMVNHKIRCRDKVRMPGPREKRAPWRSLPQGTELSSALPHTLQAGHRRFKYAAEEQGFLACKASSSSSIVYVNKSPVQEASSDHELGSGDRQNSNWSGRSARSELFGSERRLEDARGGMGGAGGMLIMERLKALKVCSALGSWAEGALSCPFLWNMTVHCIQSGRPAVHQKLFARIVSTWTRMMPWRLSNGVYRQRWRCFFLAVCFRPWHWATFFTTRLAAGRGGNSSKEGIRVVTYNVLSPTVCSEDSFPRCRSEDLQEALRLQRVLTKLDDAISTRPTVICLQEVTEKWAGELHQHFTSKDWNFAYCMTPLTYYRPFGVAMAWPKTLRLEALQFIHPAYVLQPTLRRIPAPEESFWRKLWARIRSAFSRATEADSSEPVNRQAKAIHCALLRNALKNSFPDDPLVLAGDFNTKPKERELQLLQQGQLDPEEPRSCHMWRS